MKTFWNPIEIKFQPKVIQHVTQLYIKFYLDVIVGLNVMHDNVKLVGCDFSSKI